VPRYKQFCGSGPDLEAKVNAWLEEFEPDVTLMSQSIQNSGSVTLGFLYDESFRGQERRLDNEHGMKQAAGAAAPEATMPEDPVQVRITPPEQGPEPETGV
jgi:hypothetical protein